MMIYNPTTDETLVATCPKCNSTVKRFYFDILGCPTCGHPQKEKETNES
ncbi:hypothetical protein H0A36_19260 [Endozoicomonas sp. SM1973]|uniref:Uncharacterized protein n=1 Tax=Spartinivicinus marinus TaxID=2994442 RepID=A0A853I2I2_9GAMM|nr:hypothetical protein [Spartinivicinus marinus]MCX4029321.1 hypothetical protein [Spartinivicinus marinus]NYZ68160.1 hypothetical protein [Spartinivicinus marinus]